MVQGGSPAHKSRDGQVCQYIRYTFKMRQLLHARHKQTNQCQRFLGEIIGNYLTVSTLRDYSCLQKGNGKIMDLLMSQMLSN